MYTRAINLRPCSQCKHFKLGRCKLFVQIVPDGIPVNTKADNARNDPYLCGTEGLYFSDKTKTLDVLK
jgi:hypothetical protein